jgi:hypothetical protein
MVDQARLRVFIVNHFSDTELDDLCFDHFQKVRDQFGSGMSKADKVKILIEYCNNHKLMDSLLKILANERPEAYQEEFGQTTCPLPPPPPDGSQRVTPPFVWGAVLALVVLAIAIWAVLNFVWQRGAGGPAASIPPTLQDAGEAAETAVIPPIRITNPADNGKVGRIVTVQGELAGELCAGCQLYLFVHPVHSQSNYYYPQSDAQIDLSVDSFTASGVVVGGSTIADNNKQYEIWVALSANAPPETRLTADEWQAFQKEATDVITVTRVEL